MFRDDFKNRYTTIPFEIYRAYYEHERIAAISHQHKEIELISVNTGSADFYIDTQCYKIKKGDVLLIPPYSLHRAKTTSENTSYVCICFDLCLLCDEALKTGLEGHTLSTKCAIDRALPYAEQLRACMENSCRACEEGAEGWELEAVGNLSLFFGILKKNGHFSPVLPNQADLGFAKKVLDYVAEHYSSAITSNSVSNALYINNNYFCRLFKKNFGCCFSNYILTYRLEKAKTLLSNEALSITEVAFQTGFIDCSYFCKTFKAYVGCSPRSYRKNDPCEKPTDENH